MTLDDEQERLLKNIVEAIKRGTAEYEARRKAKLEGHDTGHDRILVADHGSGPVHGDK